MRKEYNFSKMKKRKSKIKEMVKSELLELSKIKDVSKYLKKLEQLEKTNLRRKNLKNSSSNKPMKAKMFRDLIKSISEARMIKSRREGVKSKNKKYKSFRLQALECAKNGTRISVPCIICDQVNLICKKYNCYCHSKACLKERI